MTTYCRDCDCVHPQTRGENPWNWRCLKVPVAAGYRFVDPTYSPNPPYEICSRVNTDGECPMFSPLPEPDNEQPKSRQFDHHRRTLEATRR